MIKGAVEEPFSWPSWIPLGKAPFKIYKVKIACTSSSKIRCSWSHMASGTFHISIWDEWTGVSSMHKDLLETKQHSTKHSVCFFNFTGSFHRLATFHFASTLRHSPNVAPDRTSCSMQYFSFWQPICWHQQYKALLLSKVKRNPEHYLANVW